MNGLSQLQSTLLESSTATFLTRAGSALCLTKTDTGKPIAYLFHSPLKEYSAWFNNGRLVDSNGRETTAEALRSQAESHATEVSGCMAGFLSYECLHDVKPEKLNDLALPAIQINVYEKAIALDEIPLPSEDCIPPFRLKSHFKASESRADYLAALAKIQRYIKAGDCYQINYAQHFRADFDGDVSQAFLELLANFNAPYGGFLHTQSGQIASVSPEQFVHVKPSKRIETRPIKGSAARAADQQQDQHNAQALLNSSKNRAENLMIVDLLRNDLGKICETGSVITEKLFELETYTNVHHLVSTISGKLQPTISPLQALFSCFPGGSITGAPKVRAMEIIDELEKQPRSAYCGSMFFQLENGELHSNIMIRTLSAAHGQIHCWGGGGIVADSDPEEEYRESLFKVTGFMRHLESLCMAQANDLER